MPTQAEIWCHLGSTQQAQGRLDEAVASFRRALELKPDFAEALNNLGLALAGQGKPNEAAASFRQAMRFRPDYHEAHRNLQNAVLEAKKLGVQLMPRLAEAHHELAQAYAEQNRLDEALASYQKAIWLKPDFIAAYTDLGLLLWSQGRLDEAVTVLERVVQIDPNSAIGHNNLALVLAGQGKRDEAVTHYRRAVEIDPAYAQAYSNMAIALREQNRLDEAAVCCEQAVRLKPDWADAHNNLGTIRRDQGRLAEAEASFRQATQFRPTFINAYSNLGVVLAEQGNLEAAVETYEQALRLNPNDADVRKNRALAWLLAGNYQQGWPEFKWRWQCKEIPGSKRPFAIPLWDGSPLMGRTILLHAAGGRGDAIQFVRFAPLVKQRGGRVIVECRRDLVGFLASCAGVDELVADDAELPSFDVQAPLLDVPAILGTTLSSIPADIPYLSADPALVRRWGGEVAKGRQGDKETRRQGDKETRRQGDKETRRQGEGNADHDVSSAKSCLPVSLSPCLPVFEQEFKIGIVWQGSTSFRADYLRSCRLVYFAPLARIEGVRLFSLQKELGMEQLAEAEFPVTDLGSRLENFMDTAAVLKNLDLVVAVDTAIVHCAGALGLPVWVALPFAADWRWLLEREDSPWYPTVRLFRQKRWGDWNGVFANIAEEVRHLPGKIFHAEQD